MAQFAAWPEKRNAVHSAQTLLAAIPRPRADVVLRTVEKLKRLSRFQSTADLATVPALDQMERNFYGVVRERRVLAFCRGSALY